jgi:small conductance mechanosensitive channel
MQAAQDLTDLKTKRDLAKERFDLAIRERKTLQEQIATLQAKIDQDADALKKARGEGQTAGAGPERAPSMPTTGGAPGSAGSDPLPEATPSSTMAAPSPSPASAGTRFENTPELIAARQDAGRKQNAADSAQVMLKSIAERMDALRRSVELEKQLTENGRKKASNAEETEKALYDTLQRKWQEGAPQAEIADLRQQIDAARQRLKESREELRASSDRLSKYQTELATLQGEHIAAMEEAGRRREEADRAQKKVVQLQSPFSPRNLWRWLVHRGPRIGAIILAMFVALWAARLGESRIVGLIAGRSGKGNAEDRENRAQTLVGIVHSAGTIAIYAGGGLMVLTEVGINIVPLMGGAAVLGLAVAFGAQNLLRDYFYGFMILLEEQYGINDVIKLGDVAGQVERITLRITVMRGLDGTVHFVPNGEIKQVSNMTHQWSRAVFDIPIAYKEDVDRVMEELLELARQLRRDPDFRGLIVEMPEMLGVDEFADSAVIIKFLVKTRPLKQWIVKRELLRRIKKRFDELGIEIPFPHRTVFHRFENGTQAQLDPRLAEATR